MYSLYFAFGFDDRTAELSYFYLQFLIAKSTENINHRNLDGYTPLHLGCLYDKPECVKALLAAGADANIYSAKSGTASSKSILHLSANIEMLNLVISIYRLNRCLP